MGRRRLGPALASFPFALALAACGDEKSSEGLTGSSSETGASPTPLAAQIVALTKQGDVVVIDRETRKSRVIASFPPREDPQVEAGSFRAVDVTALPDGRFLVATCCEPAAGHMYALSEDGHRLKDQDIFAEDAGHDADARVASGELVGLVIRPLSDLNSAAYTLAPPPHVSGFSPASISWSAADDSIVFTLGDTIGVVDVAADSLADATYVDPPDGSYWAGVANTAEGTVAIEQGGDPLHPSGPSRLVRVDMDTGASTKLVSTDGRITDLAVDPTGSYLPWVEGGDLHWLAADVEAAPWRLRRSGLDEHRVAGPSEAKVYDSRVQNYLLTTLPSGARVISEPLDTVRSVALGLWIGTGSRDEDDARAGVTHFLEHLLFKGTEKYSAQEIAEVFDGFGGELNAATARDYTVVYGRVLDEHVEEALDVMTDLVFAPELVDLDSEREVVLEEIAMVEDTPQELIHDLLTQAVFGNHPLGRPVLGSAEVIANVSRRSIAAYHRARYAPGNVVVAAAGNLAHEGLIALVEGMEAKIRPAGRRPAARAPWVSAPPPRLAFQRKDTEQYHLCLGAPGISRSDKRRFAASILDGILGGSASSRLFQEIREKRGLAYTVYTFSSQYADTGQIGVYVGTRAENLGACLEIVAEQIEVVAAGDVTEDELARAKENLKGRIMLSMEMTSNRMSRLGKSLITDSELLDLDRILAEIDAVDASSVAELTGALLARERLSVAAVGPSEKRVLKAVEPVCPDLISAAAA